MLSYDATAMTEPATRTAGDEKRDLVVSMDTYVGNVELRLQPTQYSSVSRGR